MFKLTVDSQILNKRIEIVKHKSIVLKAYLLGRPVVKLGKLPLKLIWTLALPNIHLVLFGFQELLKPSR